MNKKKKSARLELIRARYKALFGFKPVFQDIGEMNQRIKKKEVLYTVCPKCKKGEDYPGRSHIPLTLLHKIEKMCKDCNAGVAHEAA